MDPVDHSQKKSAALADQLKALGHPVRLEIIQYLSKCDHRCCGEVCDCLPLAQSTVSQHLDILKKANLVTAEQDGNRSRFSLNRDALNRLKQKFELLTTDSQLDEAKPSQKET